LIHTETRSLECVPPFSFDLRLTIFSEGDRSIRRCEEGKFWQVVRVDDILVLVSMKALGTVDDPKLSVELTSDHKMSEGDEEKAKQTVSVLLNIDLDLKPFYKHAKDDLVLTDIIRRFRRLKIPTTPIVFEALIDSIIEQQISLSVAHVLQARLIKAFGKALRVHAEVYYAYPTPRDLATTDLKQSRTRGLSRKKAEYIKEVSRIVVDGDLDLERFKRYNDTKRIITESLN
jgi:DNA-3-methyladenine glycosylase II